jgi:hypothetical protein
MTLSTSLPAGLVLLALVVGFCIGLIMGGLAQRPLDRMLRCVAVRRAVQATVAAMQPAGVVGGRLARPASTTGLPAAEQPAPVETHAQRGLSTASAAPTTTPGAARPGMPFYRELSGGVSR